MSGLKAILNEVGVEGLERIWTKLGDSEKRVLVSGLETACANALTEGGSIKSMWGTYMDSHGNVFSSDDLGDEELAEVLGALASDRVELIVIDDGEKSRIETGLRDMELLVVTDNRKGNVILSGHRLDSKDSDSDWLLSGLSRKWNQKELLVYLVDLEETELIFMGREGSKAE